MHLHSRFADGENAGDSDKRYVLALTPWAE
jgi:hypothetical protein